GLYAATASQGRINPLLGTQISAEATSAAGPPGCKAAAEGLDPFSLPGGTSYPYAPTLDASLQVPAPSSTGGVLFYALDSVVFTTDDIGNFVVDGSPYQDTLWTLSVSADGLV